jgi:TonB-linked SusC/RagA family outer membrane protein
MRQVLRRPLATLALLAAFPVAAAAQENATITGRVTGEGGSPLTGVTVAITELGIGTQTREDGRYSLAVPGGRVLRQSAVLVARRVGYKPRSVRVTINPGVMTQDFSLETNPLQLGEVVITGAGTAMEVEKLGNVRNNVSADLIVKANETNLVAALAGKAPNVQVSASSGDPGASSSIHIRGLRTLNGTAEPLFIIDGVPVDNSSFSTSNLNPLDSPGGETEGTSQPNRVSDFNPNDIENVEILKGAAAAAIYGARAANGVILITTKRGKGGQTKYGLRSTFTNDDVTRKYPLETTYGQGLGNVASGPCNSIGIAKCRRSWGAKLTGPAYDHASEAFTTGHLADNVLTASGGSDRTLFYLSGGYSGNRGVFVGPNNYYNKATVRLNASHKLADAFTLGGNFAYSDARGHFTQRGNNVNGLLLGLLRTPPDFNNLPYLDPTSGLHRSYRLQNPGPETAGQDRGFNNPFYTLYEELNQAQAGHSYGNVNAEYLPNEWLKFNYTLGADYTNDERLEGCPAECSDVGAGGRVVQGKLTTYQIDHNLTATARYTVNENIGGSLTLGQNLNSREFRSLGIVGRQLIAIRPFLPSNTIRQDPTYNYETYIHNESYFGQTTVELFNQLFLTGALRNDGSSTFGNSNNRNWFPKASVAWNFTNAFQPSFLTYGKLRVSYGQAGNEPNPYATSFAYTNSAIINGVSQGTGLDPVQSGRGGVYFGAKKGIESLKPERTRETEFGIDLGLFKDLADVSITHYDAKTTDVILSTPLAPSSGYTFQFTNAGIFENKGVEISLNLRPITREHMAWDIGAGWARNRSNVVSLAGAKFLYIDNGFGSPVAIEGQELGVAYTTGLVRCGISPNGAVPGVDLAKACGNAPIGALYIDDGTNCSSNPGMPCGDDNNRVLANPNPRWTGNVHSTLRFGSVAFSGLLDIKKGGQIYNGTKGALWSYGTHQETENRAICTSRSNAACTGNVHAFGDPDWYPGAVAGPGAGLQIPIGENWYRGPVAACPFTGYQEQCFEDGGYVKLRELSVAYTATGAWVTRSMGLSSVDFRVAGRNLKTWTKYTGLDPETNVAQGLAKIPGSDYFNLPMSRSIVFTVGLNR